MKFNKILALCKKSRHFYIFTQEDKNYNTLQWLSDGYAAYPLNGHPLYDEESIFYVASMSEKQKEKCFYMEQQIPDIICADDLADNEQPVQVLEPSIQFGGELLLPVSTSEGLQFIAAKYMAPIDEDSWEIYERRNKNGIYFVVKVGMFVNAIVAKKNIISERMVECIDELNSQMVTAWAVEKSKQSKVSEQMEL